MFTTNLYIFIALDPSLFGWTHHPDRLNPDDADLVEVLHTTAGILGYDYPLGDLDFYPNGGSAQNGCGATVSCSHIYSYAFYAESITSAASGGTQFVGTECESYEQAIALQCAGATDVVFGGLESKEGYVDFITQMYIERLFLTKILLRLRILAFSSSLYTDSHFLVCDLPSLTNWTRGGFCFHVHL